MKLRYRRLQRLEQRLAALAASGPEEVSDDAWEAWYRGGCLGPLPPPGPRPVKYTPAQWQVQHRLFLMLCCRAVGRFDPPEMTSEERRQADEMSAFFAAIDAGGQLSLPQQARLASYREVIVRFLNDRGGGTVPPTFHHGESS